MKMIKVKKIKSKKDKWLNSWEKLLNSAVLQVRVPNNEKDFIQWLFLIDWNPLPSCKQEFKIQDAKGKIEHQFEKEI